MTNRQYDDCTIMVFGRGRELFQLQFLKIAEKASHGMAVGLVPTSLL